MLIYCEVHGGPTERGLRIGKQLSAEIHAFYDHFLKATFQTERDSDLEERLLESAILHSSLLRSFVPEATQELDAISVSAKISYDRLLLMNMFHEMGSNSIYHILPSNDSIEPRNIPFLKTTQIQDIIFQKLHETGFYSSEEIPAEGPRGFELLMGETFHLQSTNGTLVLYKYNKFENLPALFFLAPAGIVGGCGMNNKHSITWFPKPVAFSDAAHKLRKKPTSNLVAGSHFHSPLEVIGFKTEILSVSGALLARWLLQQTAADLSSIEEQLKHIHPIAKHTFLLGSSQGDLTILENTHGSSGWSFHKVSETPVAFHPLASIQAKYVTAVPVSSRRHHSISSAHTNIHRDGSQRVPLTAASSKSGHSNPIANATSINSMGLSSHPPETLTSLDLVRESFVEVAQLLDETNARVTLATETLRCIRDAESTDAAIQDLKELVQVLSQNTNPEHVEETLADSVMAVVFLPSKASAIIGTSYQDNYDLVQL